MHRAAGFYGDGEFFVGKRSEPLGKPASIIKVHGAFSEGLGRKP